MTPTCPGCIQLHTIMKHIPSWTFFQKNMYRKCCLSARIKAPFQSPLLSTLSPNIQQAAACRQLWTSRKLQLHTFLLILFREVSVGRPGHCSPAEQNSKMPRELLLLAFLSFRVPSAAFVLPWEGCCRASQGSTDALTGNVLGSLPAPHEPPPAPSPF